MEAINVVLCADRNVLWGLAVTVRSLLEHATRPVSVTVICDRFSPADKCALERSWKHEKCKDVAFFDLDPALIRRFRTTLYLRSKSAYSRYFIADALPDAHRCIYLDVDLLVLRDLADVYDIDLKGKICAAALDPSTQSQPVNPQLRKRLGIPDETSYFNSGFMVIDLEQWRRLSVRDKLVRISLERPNDLHLLDQDALNIVLHNSKVLLDSAWNSSQHESPDASKPVVIHLTGTIKPWHARYSCNYTSRYYRTTIQPLFFDILDRTVYAGQRPWNPGGLGRISEQIRSAIPSPRMVKGKIVRLYRSFAYPGL